MLSCMWHGHLGFRQWSQEKRPNFWWLMKPQLKYLYIESIWILPCLFLSCCVYQQGFWNRRFFKVWKFSIHILKNDLSLDGGNSNIECWREKSWLCTIPIIQWLVCSINKGTRRNLLLLNISSIPVFDD